MQKGHHQDAFISGKAMVRDAAQGVLLSFIKKQNQKAAAAAASEAEVGKKGVTADTGLLMKHLSSVATFDIFLPFFSIIWGTYALSL